MMNARSFLGIGALSLAVFPAFALGQQQPAILQNIPSYPARCLRDKLKVCADYYFEKSEAFNSTGATTELNESVWLFDAESNDQARSYPSKELLRDQTHSLQNDGKMLQTWSSSYDRSGPNSVTSGRTNSVETDGSFSNGGGISNRDNLYGLPEAGNFWYKNYNSQGTIDNGSDTTTFRTGSEVEGAIEVIEHIKKIDVTTQDWVAAPDSHYRMTFDTELKPLSLTADTANTKYLADFTFDQNSRFVSSRFDRDNGVKGTFNLDWRTRTATVAAEKVENGPVLKQTSTYEYGQLQSLSHITPDWVSADYRDLYLGYFQPLPAKPFDLSRINLAKYKLFSLKSPFITSTFFESLDAFDVFDRDFKGIHATMPRWVCTLTKTNAQECKTKVTLTEKETTTVFELLRIYTLSPRGSHLHQTFRKSVNSVLESTEDSELLLNRRGNVAKFERVVKNAAGETTLQILQNATFDFSGLLLLSLESFENGKLVDRMTREYF